MTGQLCGCDFHNYGDLLYPIIFRELARKHGLGGEIAPLGFFSKPAPGAAGYDVQSIPEVIRPGGPGLTRLFIGGGDILRTDVEMLAAHYYPYYKKSAASPFWLEVKERCLGRRRMLKQFARQFMGHSPIAPFILDPAGHSNIGAVVYCSCGTPFPFAPEKSAAIRAAFERAAFVYVRDASSGQKIRDIGVRRDIEVAPDLVVTLSDFFDRAEERRKGLAVLARQGINPAREIICVQSSPQTFRKADELLSQLLALKKATGAEIILLPVCYCHGDQPYLQKLAEKSGGALRCLDILSVPDTLAVLAACRSFIGTSMHANITAFSFGIPHLFGPIAVDKVPGFLEVVGLDMDFQLKSWTELAERHARLMRLPEDYFSTRAAAAKQRVHATFRKMATALNGTKFPV